MTINSTNYLKPASQPTTSLSNDISSFIKNHPYLCAGTLGIAPLGYAIGMLGNRVIFFIREKLSGSPLKVNDLALPLLKTTTPPTTLPLPTPAVTLQPSKIAFLGSFYERFFPCAPEPKEVSEQKPFKQALEKTSPFLGYIIQLPKGHPSHGVSLMNTSKRPANFLFDAFFDKTSINVTQPGQKLFAWNSSQSDVADFIKTQASTNQVVSFSANGKSGLVGNQNVKDLSSVFGKNTYKISSKEVLELLKSQKVYTSSLLPLSFYLGLKEAMKQDNIVMLQEGRPPVYLKDINSIHIKKFLTKVQRNPTQYGFQSAEHLKTFYSLTLYQIGAMVVKSQDFHVLIDGDSKILSRKEGTKDAIRLVDICGIRGFHDPKTEQRHNLLIMQETFKTALIAAQEGIALVPAVGMGVWAGDPDLYWRAFLDAVITSDTNLELIGVNPGHKGTPQGKYQGRTGDEFTEILEEYKQKAKDAGDTKALTNLGKLYNLQSSKKDLVQLARNLKLAYPNKTISLINASDPDVTLGYHVGEYTNSVSQGCTTTEENYTALGTNGFCFEGITGVIQDPSRVFQT